MESKVYSKLKSLRTSGICGLGLNWSTDVLSMCAQPEVLQFANTSR